MKWICGLCYGLWKFSWPFLFFLRSLIPKKSSGMQKPYVWVVITPTKNQHKNFILVHCDILVRFLVQMKTSKSHSEIKWPLVNIHDSQGSIFFLFSGYHIRAQLLHFWMLRVELLFAQIIKVNSSLGKNSCETSSYDKTFS